MSLLEIQCDEALAIVANAPMWVSSVRMTKSEEGLRVCDVESRAVTPFWMADVQFGFVFDGRGWVMAAHESSGSPGGSGRLEVSGAEIGAVAGSVNRRQLKWLMGQESMVPVDEYFRRRILEGTLHGGG